MRGRHYGPAAPHVFGRGEHHERLDDALAVGDRDQTIRHLDQQIARLETERASIMRDGLPDDRADRRDHSSSSGPSQSDDQSRER